MTNKILCAATLIVTLSTPDAFGQTGTSSVISGLVLDEDDQPIANAEVRLYQEGRHVQIAKSQVDGSYEIPLSPGRYIRLLYSAGLDRVMWPVEYLSGNKPSRINIVLFPSHAPPPGMNHRALIGMLEHLSSLDLSVAEANFLRARLAQTEVPTHLKNAQQTVLAKLSGDSLEETDASVPGFTWAVGVDEQPADGTLRLVVAPNFSQEHNTLVCPPCLEGQGTFLSVFDPAGASGAGEVSFGAAGFRPWQGTSWLQPPSIYHIDAISGEVTGLPTYETPFSSLDFNDGFADIVFHGSTLDGAYAGTSPLFYGFDAQVFSIDSGEHSGFDGTGTAPMFTGIRCDPYPGICRDFSGTLSPYVLVRRKAPPWGFDIGQWGVMQVQGERPETEFDGMIVTEDTVNEPDQ